MQQQMLFEFRIQLQTFSQMQIRLFVIRKFGELVIRSPMRIDKWLWSVRIFKTRALATAACKGGKIKLNGDIAKPAKELKTGDELNFKFGPITKTISVKDFPPNRVAAKFVEKFLDDLTSPEEYEKLKLMKELGPPIFHSGKGRPTKKDRRKMDGYF